MIRMRRSLAWAFAALYPALLLVLISIAEETVGLPTTNQLLATYWYVVLALPCAVLFLFFPFHAATDQSMTSVRRAAWVLSLVLFFPLAAPAYWWLRTEANDELRRAP